MNKKLQKEIHEALSTPGSAEDRLRAFLALDASGRPGAVELRKRQERVKRRLLELRVQRCGPIVPWSPGRQITREGWSKQQHRRRLEARERRLAEEKALRREARAARLTRRFVPVVEQRGGETEIVGKYGTETLSAVDWQRGVVLLTAQGWRQYSRRFGARHAGLAYLCGVDDSGPWAVRVPATMTRVAEALAWLEPSEVTRARERGRKVVRQGDVYAVETQRRYDGKGAEELERHTWDPAARILSHPEHEDLSVPYPARFVAQRALLMGRQTGRGAAD